MLKSELIAEVQKIYPYYTRLASMKKSELLYLYNKKCPDIPLIFNKNSCYMDSLFVALFIGDIDKKIYNLIVNNNSTNPNVIKIRTQLKQIYNVITGKTYKETTCSRLRHNINSFFKEYQAANPNAEETEWKRSQVDPTRLMEFLGIIFNTPYMVTERISTYGSLTKKIISKDLITGANRKEKSTFIHTISSDIIMGKKKILLKNIFPNRKEIVHLDRDNLYNINGTMVSTKIKKINVLSAPLIYINIDRLVVGMEKLDTVIVPFQKLKLIDNKLPLYLKSILVHRGNAGGGHYVCVFECKDNWYLYDDLESNIESIGKFQDLLNRDDILENSKAFIYA